MTIPISLLVLHFVADFVLQSHWMAINKSKRWDALFCHVFVYSLCFFLYGFPFVCYTFAFHFVIDACTSRVTSYLWREQEVHWFFVVIGFDQLLHFVTLAYTYRVLVGA